jgi:hypothetical protein
MDRVFCNRACSRVGMQQAKHKGSSRQELRLGSGAKQNCGEGVSVSRLVQVNRNARVFQQTLEAPFSDLNCSCSWAWCLSLFTEIFCHEFRQNDQQAWASLQPERSRSSDC